MCERKNGASLSEIILERGYKTLTMDRGQAFPLAVIREEIEKNPVKYLIKNKRVYKSSN
jgi:hypothetical protein